MDLHLKDKVVIVTGGTKGIGEGIVRSMAAEGANVFMVNRAGTEGPAIETELAGKGLKVTYLAAELTEVPECRRVVDVAMARFGRIDVIVNNAGFNDQVDLRSEPEAFMKGLRDNLIHYYALVHYSHDTLIQNRGNIVNIGSHVSITGQGHTSAYVAAKGAIDGLTREWAAYFCDKGVRVNCLVPGSVWTSSYVRWAAQFPDPAGAAEDGGDEHPLRQAHDHRRGVRRHGRLRRLRAGLAPDGPDHRQRRRLLPPRPRADMSRRFTILARKFDPFEKAVADLLGPVCRRTRASTSSWTSCPSTSRSSTRPS